MPAARSTALFDPPRPAPSTSNETTRARWAAAPDVVREPVEVRTETEGGVPIPTQLLWGGRLWVVRAAEPVGRGRWQVAAAPGPEVLPVMFELEHRDGRWSLVELQARGAGPAWG